MRIKINLLQETQKVKTRLRQWGVLLQTVSIVILVIYGFIVFSIFSYSIFLGSQQNRVTKKIDDRKNTIEELRSVEIKHLLVKEKIGLIRGIFQDYGINHSKVTSLYSFLIDKIIVGDIKYAEEEGAIRFGGRVLDIVGFTSFMDEIVAYAQEESFSPVLLGEISRNDRGEYFFEIVMFFSD